MNLQHNTIIIIWTLSLPCHERETVSADLLYMYVNLGSKGLKSTWISLSFNICFSWNSLSWSVAPECSVSNSEIFLVESASFAINDPTLSLSCSRFRILSVSSLHFDSSDWRACVAFLSSFDMAAPLDSAFCNSSFTSERRLDNMFSASFWWEQRFNIIKKNQSSLFVVNIFGRTWLPGGMFFSFTLRHRSLIQAFLQHLMQIPYKAFANTRNVS